MSKRQAPHDLKIRLRSVRDGSVIERWPVDARGMIASGEYTVDTSPMASAPAATVAPSVASPPTPTVLPLAERSYKDLQALAKKCEINANQKQADLIAALEPFVAQGVVSLEVLPPIQLPAKQFPGAVEGE